MRACMGVGQCATCSPRAKSTSSNVMPDDVLKMVWVAIGGDAGGLKSDKFGPFMKKGQGDAGPGDDGEKIAAQGAYLRALDAT